MRKKQQLPLPNQPWLYLSNILAFYFMGRVRLDIRKKILHGMGCKALEHTDQGSGRVTIPGSAQNPCRCGTYKHGFRGEHVGSATLKADDLKSLF